MARYISLHTLGCLPKPAFVTLCTKLFASSGVRVCRIVAGQIGEKMLIEFDASSAESAQAWLAANKLIPQWLLRIDYESADGAVHAL
ncbi:MAG: hypothetical protein M3Z37_04845 [Candidatus Eremiobacteraeota bacterium]|nr:hypothetical protein [Candidatus Eremiobacteraeota bacterium]